MQLYLDISDLRSLHQGIYRPKKDHLFTCIIGEQSNPTKSSVNRGYNFQLKNKNCIGEKYILEKIPMGNSHKNRVTQIRCV